MKLILLTLLICLATTICGQKFQQDQFPFPPQFQTPSSTFTSDSSIYLPPESHTAIPYFTINNLNKLPFQFLPPTGTKAPSMFPTSFPLFMSSTLRFNDEEDEEENDEEKSNNPIPAPNRIPQNNFNRANNNTFKQAQEKKDSIFNARMSNQPPALQPSQSIQPRFDVKPPSYVTIGPKEREQKSINPAARRMIITSEIQKPESSMDHAKASSYQSPQYVQAPGVFISSTTEPAIPILRLSNEMDLDGSFSYEALGADQTHYVQHSRMENMGSDKEEQVVEGSYSYVGDDGRTYTVHYVADSNGFRATGDHLPVPPPIPEIIQRAVQYNLAEEAKRPPHVKASWETDDKEYEMNERSFYNNLSPPRNLFTGKTPEAFSFGYSHGSNKENNLMAAESFQVPAKQSFEIQQTKPKVNPMPTPQITFLASQGAHNPSSQQAPTKASNSEKPSLPQLMNYEAEIKESDQEANKALWRWQYGLNANMDQNLKNSISRSSAEGDDVIINFNNMTPDQYTNMIHTQILPQNTESSNQADDNTGDKYMPSYHNEQVNKTIYNPEEYHVTTEKLNLYTQQIEEMINKESTNNNIYGQMNIQKDTSITRKESSAFHPDIISSHNFTPQSQIATQSYNFEEALFEPIKITTPSSIKTLYKVSDNEIFVNYNGRPSTVEPVSNTQKTTLNAYVDQENSSFTPITYNIEKTTKQETTTTEASMSEMLRENMFLRNLFKTSNNEENMIQKSTLEQSKPSSIANIEKPEIRRDVESKYINIQENPQNDVKFIKSKPLDINNILNYVVLKNHFESIKTKQKNKPVQHYIHSSKLKDIPKHYIPINENTNYYVEPNDEDIQKQDNDFKTLNRQHQHELQGLIKNYKVLQRQKQKGQTLPEPQRHIKAFHTQSLPPLGRAGPSMKSYLPPTYT